MTALLIAQRPPMQGGAAGGGFQGGPSIKGIINGKVIDSNSNEPVEFATVVLVDTKTKKEVDGTISDEKGDFKLTDVRMGKYELHFSFFRPTLHYHSIHLFPFRRNLEHFQQCYSVTYPFGVSIP